MEEADDADIRRLFDTNFFGIIRMTRAVVPHMRRQGSGRIINIGSVLGLAGAQEHARLGRLQVQFLRHATGRGDATDPVRVLLASEIGDWAQAHGASVTELMKKQGAPSSQSRLPGGTLVFATCSLEPAEGEEQAARVGAYGTILMTRS